MRSRRRIIAFRSCNDAQAKRLTRLELTVAIRAPEIPRRLEQILRTIEIAQRAGNATELQQYQPALERRRVRRDVDEISENLPR